jgi:hypothetical protein
MTGTILCAARSVFSLCNTRWIEMGIFGGILRTLRHWPAYSSCLKKAHTIGDGHLYTAVSIFLLFGLQ